jgi:hypothetical protein
MKSYGILKMYQETSLDAIIVSTVIVIKIAVMELENKKKTALLWILMEIVQCALENVIMFFIQAAIY